MKNKGGIPMSDYSSAIKVFSNIRSLRALARETDRDVLADIVEKLQTVVAELDEEKAAEREKAEAIAQKKKEALDYLASMGLTLEDLAGSGVSGAPRKTKEPRPYKYEFKDENGNTKKWTGQGRTPKALQKALDDGRKLEEFLIS